MYNDIFEITSVIQDTGLSKTLPFPGPLLGAPRRMELGPVGSITTGNTGRGQDNDLSSILTLVQMSGQLRPSALHTSALNHLATFKALSGRCLLLCNPRKTELDRIIFSLEALIFLHFVLVRRQTKIQNFSFFFFSEFQVPESLPRINYNTFQYLQEKQSVLFQNIITSHTLL